MKPLAKEKRFPVLRQKLTKFCRKTCYKEACLFGESSFQTAIWKSQQWHVGIDIGIGIGISIRM